MLKVAARRSREVPSLTRSSWTTEATPLSMPTAFAGYRGWTSLETSLGTAFIANWQLPIAD
jgi:hypothetical protein